MRAHTKEYRSRSARCGRLARKIFFLISRSLQREIWVRIPLSPPNKNRNFDTRNDGYFIPKISIFLTYERDKQ